MSRRPPKKGERGYVRIAHDAYNTPAWVTNVLLDKMPVMGQIWEPAAGDGHMVAALRKYGHSVFASDIRALPGLDRTPCDFAGGIDWVVALDRKEIPFPDWIITNPPYQNAQDFIRRALAVTRENAGAVAMLLGYEFDAPKSHREWFEHPAFHAKIVLPKRITWVGLEGKASPRQVHAFYVWRWDAVSGGARIIYA